MSTPLQTQHETLGPIRLTVDLPQGDVKVTAGEGPGTVVRLIPHGKGGDAFAEQIAVTSDDHSVSVIAPKKGGFLGIARGSVDVEVSLVAGSSIDVRTGSGDVTTRGELGETRIGTGSGDVTLQETAAAQVKSGSGDITLRAGHGDVRLKTGSGDIAVGQSGGRLEALTGSGDIEVGRLDAEAHLRTGSGDIQAGSSVTDLEVTTGSGDVRLDAIHGGDVTVRTGTGDVVVGIPHGVATYLDVRSVTGDVRIDLDETDGPGESEAHASLAVQSGSGDITVRRATTEVLS